MALYDWYLAPPGRHSFGDHYVIPLFPMSSPILSLFHSLTRTSPSYASIIASLSYIGYSIALFLHAATFPTLKRLICDVQTLVSDTGTSQSSWSRAQSILEANSLCFLFGCVANCNKMWIVMRACMKKSPYAHVLTDPAQRHTTMLGHRSCWDFFKNCSSLFLLVVRKAQPNPTLWCNVNLPSHVQS
ncbi:hypothetical protein IW261DRAFT_1116891 [Armillaria novae-zelandiae]|uniref:Uncharacterized protein n=1 Tax=Armillaria novae-zelandiae TaxID=153914 RepID=A0AA39NJ27_9AGAR|nr:hypothetical protein IW261DRAFT_1116891 [Armillaria novae-zelandiae]